MNCLLIHFLGVILGMGNVGIYGPLCHDMPMIRHERDMRLDLDLNSTIGTTSVAYAFNDHWGVQGSLQGLRNGGQLSIGWFATNAANSVFEVYAGVAAGHGIEIIEDRHDIHEALFQSYFIQADRGWCGLADSHIDIALGLKIGYLSGNCTNLIHVTDPETLGLKTVKYSYSDSSPFFEPMVQFRLGWKHIKLNLNVSRTFSLFSITSSDLRVGMGINCYFKVTSKK